ncbi:MAG: Cgl0159 family (beta/alpha)8-fold protein [Limnochordia bacterium]|jgi:DhnA family fructose-bisphosphate aldolase class Ia/sugar phosphate isomerase/epimerase
MALEKNPISIVHSMAYPGPGNTRSVSRGEPVRAYLLRTIKEVLNDPYFQGIEITWIKDKQLRAEVAELLKASGKNVIFSAQPVQLVNEDALIPWEDISCIDEVGRQQAVERLKGCISQAYELGASQFCMVSGRDPGAESGLGKRETAFRQLLRSIDELCEYSGKYAAENNLEPMRITLEIFDRSPEPNHKNQFIGPSDEACELARRLRDNYGRTEFGLLYDLSHMPLLRGNSFTSETPAVLRELAPYLNHVHIGNCVTDPQDPLYGDSHPRFDYPGGAVDEDMLAEFVKVLVEIDYQGGIGFEVMPYGDEIPSMVVKSTQAIFDIVRSRLDVNYALGSFYYQSRRFLTERLFDLITEVRMGKRNAIVEAAENRERPKPLGPDSRLVIVAADHPARRVTNVGDNPTAMGDRMDYLARIIRTMLGEGVDGLMATPDILEEILLIDYLLKQQGSPGVLDGKLMIGSMNRSGLAGIEYEMDDRMTAMTAAHLVEMGCDGGKMLLRFDTGRMSRYSIATMDYCAKAVSECRAAGLPTFVEPLPVTHTEGGYQVIMEADALIQVIGIASALGGSSRDMWIKVPYVPEYHRVVKSTTLPILMLGGASRGNPLHTLRAFEEGMGEGANVRGVMVGRNVLFCGKDDPLAVAEAVAKLVHDYASIDEAVRHLRQARGRDLDFLASRLGDVRI